MMFIKMNEVGYSVLQKKKLRKKQYVIIITISSGSKIIKSI